MDYQGDYAEDATVYVMVNTFTSNDPSASSTITNLVNTDVHIHKDDGLTQRNNAAGITVSVDFDGITGSHQIVIDTSDDTVGGFWVIGSDYFVRIEGANVDGATINAVVGHFSIENRFKEVDLTHILGHLLTNTGTQIADAFETMFDVASPTLLASAVMRGTDNAALASVVGALADAAADGDPTEADTLMKYIKQLINILIGTDGIGAFPAEAAPANAVSLAEVIRAIHVDVTGLNGDVMVGTDGANTTVPDAAGTAASLHSTTDGKIDAVDDFVDTEVAAIKTVVDAIQADLGDFSGRTNDKSLLDVLGVPDVANKDLHTLLVTDRLDEGTYGLSALQTLLAAIPTTAMRGTDNAALASVLGALNNAAAAGDPTDADTLMQYLKQVINILVGTVGIGAFPAEAAPANAVSLAEVIRAIHVDVTGLNGDVMVGTDGANTTEPDAAGTAAGLHGTTDGKVDAIQTDIGNFSGRTNDQSLLEVLGVPDVAGKDLHTLLVTDRLDEGTFGLSALQTLLAAIPTTAMRGTDNAALASVVGALADAAAAGDPTEADTLMQYLKQLINILIGTAGIGAFPAESAPANAVSLAEVIRAIHVDVTGLNGEAMRGTNGANTTVPDAAGVAATPAEVATALTNYAGPTKAQMDTAHGLLATPAQVATEISDALTTDTQALPGQESPTATPTLAEAILYGYKRFRNKKFQSNSEFRLYADDGTTVDQKVSISESNEELTVGEMATGP